MEETRFSFLFNKYFEDQATSAETGEFFLLARSGDHGKELEQLMEKRWDDFEATENPFNERARERMLSAVFGQEEIKIKTLEPRRSWPRIAIAAAVAAAIVSVGIFFNQGNPDSGQTAYANDIAPGKHGATLTLSSGKKIRLTGIENGELAREAGVTITKTADGQLVYEIIDAGAESSKINVLSTAKGETYQVRLPDGSMVWLNAASNLTYAADLKAHGERRVRLDGEGYFEVAKDSAHPFIVESQGQHVKVLGTHFNINSYKDEGLIKTTLLEGSVRVNDEVTIVPGQQSVLSGSRIEVKQVDVNDIIDWKNGDFIFKKESLEQIMREVARWYDVDISYDPDVDVHQTFSGLVLRSKNISQVLLSMQSTGRLKFKIEGKHVFISK